MKEKSVRVAVLVALVAFCAGVVGAQEMKAPKPAVPEAFTIGGEFVRIAYNNEGWVTLGYRLANDSQGHQWMLLEVGLTLRKGVKNQKITRDSFGLQMPEGAPIGIATQKEYTNANSLRALNMRGNTIRDSINYFPIGASRVCKIGFFADAANRGQALSWDEIELSDDRACMGRIFFKLPTEITTGQYWLDVKFDNTMVQVPFRIMTKEEEKDFHKNWKSMKKEHDAGYKK